MPRIVTAIFENGVFRPVEPIEGLLDGVEVSLTVATKSAAAPFAALTVDRAAIEQADKSLSPEETAEMLRLLEEGRRRADE
jgi:predicted DNA-binding antitoxin AbrB/MazE fold protein